ncbi:TPA: Clp protease ClpP [Legionella pneumophila subsp. pneumophila]|uniref:SDH family Clp fold serine proteinase n=1 Tax=Legionella pneumophila TaxID=446 RepID=UPI0009836E40|nr:ATP-dependent Clp protease proteolytic subunit [Legionella pneumophila]HAT9589015.1 Clp protease ClpP [Legionella pneumophila subsp. pneumophila]OOK41385.1 hypothetical protein LPM_2226 [Legionella pneumophila subsp. pneumophila str. Mississauga]HAT1879423.1 Clp protease ClpP [Legionella pneumophila]HCC3233036.1 ATP-dependent Clp protease proteolytic subunit [Legionella pneumophila subsp. pneumophila]HDP0035304.1 ATP-dependent Clp protease proteolytic subunit [Legionella pneumophila]
MGIYAEYLNMQLNFQDLTNERKKQLQRISDLRKRDVLVFAADLNKNAPIAIDYTDLLPLQDQLHNLKGDKLDLIIETPGGSGEVSEDIVRLLRKRFEEVSIIVPGYAKSAGTIIAMSGDEILMGEISALGPIDAQLVWQGKIFSADALLDGLEKIKKEVLKTDILNKTYIPILQGISPGELQAAENAKKFAIKLVKEWLVEYKFKNWETHSSTGNSVTLSEKKKRAQKIAQALSRHGNWLTHGKSLKIQDLTTLGLKITDYSQQKHLNDAITRYFVLLQMTFQTNIYKIFETTNSQVYRFISPPVPSPTPLTPMQPGQNVAIIEITCNTCSKKSKIQAGLGETIQIQEGFFPFPKNNKFICPDCKSEIDISDARRQLEAQSKKSVT